MKERYLKRDKKRFFYPQEMEKVLDIAQPRQQYWIRFLLNTGARINEARHVMLQDLDHQRRNMMLWKTKVRAKKGEARPDPRNIALSTEFHRYLKKNIKLYKIPATPSVDEGIKSLSKRAGIEDYLDFSAHNLRKTFGTWMLALNVDGFKLAQHLGHSPDMLRVHYASPDIFNSDDKDRMRSLLGDLPSRLRNE